MNKRVKKIKMRSGRDATRSVVKKLLLGLITHGKLTTTLKRAKITKSNIDKLVYKSREKTEASNNVLLKNLGNREAVAKLFDVIGPKFKGRTGGYVKLVRLGQRMGDGAETARLEWIEPIVNLTNEKETIKTTPDMAQIEAEPVKVAEPNIEKKEEQSKSKEVKKTIKTKTKKE